MAHNDMTQRYITLLLAMLLGIQPVATDLYLSALPSIQSDLLASIGQTQLTLSAMLLAFGLAQLVLGPLSDRLGRRPVLLWGVAAFTLGGLAAAFATSIDMLIALRSIQGAAMGAAVMSGRAITRDLFEPERAAIVMSKAFSGLGVIALLSSLVGSSLTQYLGWRFTLTAMGLFGAALWLIIFFRYQETLTTPNPSAMQPKQMIKNWLEIGSHKGFVAYSLVSIFSYCALFTFLASSPFVLIKVLGLTKLEFGACLMVMPVFYITGTIYCRRLLRRYGVQNAVKRAAWITLLAGLTLYGFAAAGVHSLWAILAPFYLFMVGHGVMQSCGQSGSVAHFPQMAGAASALNGFLMMAAAFVVSLWLGSHQDGTALALTSSMALWCVLVSAVAWFVVPRFGKLPK